MIRHEGPMHRRVFLAATGSLALVGPHAWAQAFPSKPIRLVVPSPAGTPPDYIARLFSGEMKDDLGQAFVVDNRPGVAGGLAAGEVAKAVPDGHTLLLAVDSMLTINPFVYTRLAYDPVRDLRPVSLLATTGGVVVVHPGLGVKTWPELVRLAQSKPGVLTFASGGNGHPTHLGMELLMQKADMKMTHVPYRGTPPGLQDVVGGQVSAIFTSYVETLPHVKAGRLVALGTTGEVGKKLFPEVPELSRFYPGFQHEAWFGLFAPSGTPDAVVQRLNAAVLKAGRSATLQQSLMEGGMATLSSTPAQLGSMVQAGAERYGPIVKALGIKAD
jgi:tripartite-type tricarboxylate transporter receptor subunit TctC